MNIRVSKKESVFVYSGGVFFVSGYGTHYSLSSLFLLPSNKS